MNEINLTDFSIQTRCELPPKKINKILNQIKIIQNSIGWDNRDFRCAKRRLENPQNLLILVKKEKELIGYATLVPENEKIYVSQLAIEKIYQNRGIGKKVMKEIFNEAKQADLNEVYLDTDKNDLKLRSFYTSFSNEAKFTTKDHRSSQIRFIYHLKKNDLNGCSVNQ